MTLHRELHGLYAITDTVQASGSVLVAQVESALQGGAHLVQYRDKSTDTRKRRHDAAALVELCSTYRVPLIVNDDVELARRIGADGVHLGEDDMNIDMARSRLGTEAIIGISCYDDLARARLAEERGADYVAFGAIFPSPTKPQARHAGLETLRMARSELDVPICAIGGIDVGNAAAVGEAGADMIAVITALFSGKEIRPRAMELRRAFESGIERRGLAVSC